MADHPAKEIGKNMKRRISSSTMVVLMLVVLVTASFGAIATRSGTVQARELPGPDNQAVEATPAHRDGFKSSPMMFIENVGQWDDGARFQVLGGPAGTMWLAEDAIWITLVEPGTHEESEIGVTATDPAQTLSPDGWEDTTPRRGANIKLSFVGVNPHPRIETLDRLDTVVSYFYGNAPDKWQPNVPVWGGVRYVDLYPGVNLELTSEGWQMLSRLVANPAGSLDALQLRVEGVDDVIVDGDAIRLSTPFGEFVLPMLRADGLRVSRYPTSKSSGGPDVALSGVQTFDVVAPFVTTSAHRPPGAGSQRSPADNPADLLYSTFLGGSSNDRSASIAVDEAGSAYVAGWTNSGDFPTTPGTFDPSFNGSYDTFVAKLNPAGSELIYATFLGGSDWDSGKGIAVDGAGSTYVTGYTHSSDFPTTLGALDPSFNGGDCGGPDTCPDVFVVKLNPATGGLEYSTFLGGNSWDEGNAIAVDEAGSVHVTGYTQSSDFPTTPGAFDPSHNGSGDAFMVKLNPAGSGLAYATFLGGSGSDTGLAIVVDSTGSTTLAGFTSSGDFPTTLGAFDTSHNGSDDAFVVKLNPADSGLAYATFMGGSDSDLGFAIALDGEGSATVTGETFSSDFPTTPGAFDTNFNGGNCGFYICPDAFVAQLNPDGTGLAFSTFLGGSGDDHSRAIALDEAGNAYVTGSTGSEDFPTTTDAFDMSYNGDQDTFATRLNSVGSVVVYSTFMGDSGDDYCAAIALDEAGSAYMTGITFSSDFPTTVGAFDPSFNGNGDAFVAKLAIGSPQPCCDFDGDGTVDVDDLVIIGNLWNQPAGAPYDQDGDGMITIVDIQRVARWWGWPVT